MNPNDIQLENLNTAFEYEKLSRDLDTIADMEELKNFSKYMLKLYLKQKEVICSL